MKGSRKKSNLFFQSGQALIEWLMAVIVISLGLHVMVIGCYIYWCRIWIRYQLHETLLCRVSAPNTRFCEERLQERLKDFLPWGRIIQLHFPSKLKSIQMKFHQQAYEAQIVFELNSPLFHLIHLEEKLNFNEDFGGRSND